MDAPSPDKNDENADNDENGDNDKHTKHTINYIARKYLEKHTALIEI